MTTKTIEKKESDLQQNSITFVYESFTSSQADDGLWNQIKNRLNSLNRNQANSVKIGCSDMKGKDARGVIIYSNSETPYDDNLGTTWSSITFETSSDYERMYSDCVNFLNSQSLSETQKYYSVLTMTNASGHKSRLVLFYREY